MNDWHLACGCNYNIDFLFFCRSTLFLGGSLADASRFMFTISSSSGTFSLHIGLEYFDGSKFLLMRLQRQKLLEFAIFYIPNDEYPIKSMHSSNSRTVRDRIYFQQTFVQSWDRSLTVTCHSRCLTQWKCVQWCGTSSNTVSSRWRPSNWKYDDFPLYYRW